MEDLSELLAQQRETHALLQGHVKIADERHEDIKEQHREFKELFKTHDDRIKKCEGFRNRIYGYVIAVGAGAVATAEGIKTLLFGNGS